MLQLLIIDNFGADSRAYRHWLGKYGMRVMHAENAEDGIRLAKLHLPDVIITEIELPGLSGFQAIRQLKSDTQTKSIPVIIVSYKGNDVIQTWGMRQGACYCLSKPVVESELIARIQAVLPRINECAKFAWQS